MLTGLYPDLDLLAPSDKDPPFPRIPNLGHITLKCEGAAQRAGCRIDGSTAMIPAPTPRAG